MNDHRTDKIGGPTSEDVLYAPTVETVVLTDDGVFPNNGKLPLLIYQKALNTGIRDLASHLQTVFADHHWGNSWIDGVYDFHHYHSTAHEVLAVCSGQARILFGGEHGIERTVEAGDVIVIPAGVSHKRLDSEGNFAVVGAYPQGQEYDMCYGRHEERPKADKNIVRVPMPESDPLYGSDGPLMDHWQA
jgi:uncharacterized protein YjlB